MKRVTTLNVLRRLRRILTDALELCKSCPASPAALQDEILDYTLLYFGIEEILTWAEGSQGLRESTYDDERLLCGHAAAAQRAFSQIRDVLLPQSQDSAEARLNRPRAQPRQKRRSYFVQKLRQIVSAINSTALLLAV